MNHLDFVDTLFFVKENEYFLGEYKTTARFMRDFIRTHPDYKLDSNVSENIMYDLALKCDGISKGTVPCPELFGIPKSKSMNVTLPKCSRVKEEVEMLTEKIIMMNQDDTVEKKVNTNEITGTDFENRLGKSLGVGIINGSAPVQM